MDVYIIGAGLVLLLAIVATCMDCRKAKQNCKGREEFQTELVNALGDIRYRLEAMDQAIRNFGFDLCEVIKGKEEK